jgi:hypothetical protein
MFHAGRSTQCECVASDGIGTRWGHALVNATHQDFPSMAPPLTPPTPLTPSMGSMGGGGSRRGGGAINGRAGGGGRIRASAGFGHCMALRDIEPVLQLRGGAETWQPRSLGSSFSAVGGVAVLYPLVAHLGESLGGAKEREEQQSGRQSGGGDNRGDNRGDNGGDDGESQEGRVAANGTDTNSRTNSGTGSSESNSLACTLDLIASLTAGAGASPECRTQLQECGGIDIHAWLMHRAAMAGGEKETEGERVTHAAHHSYQCSDTHEH